MEDGGGTACAARLSHLMDEIIRALYDFAATHVYRAKNPSAAERMAVVAVGGYGRGTLAPGSDIDLLFLLPYKQTPMGRADRRIHALHAVGSGAEGRPCDPQHRRMRAAVALRHHHPHLDPGSALRLGRADAVRRADRCASTARWCKDTGPEYVQAKLAERDERHAKAGESRYLVEPNVKDGKGGLRDLQTLFWIGKYFYRVRTGEELVDKGVFTAANTTSS